MGRTHPQLPRSSDSHRILKGKTRQRWLIPIDPTLVAPSCREPGQWCEDLLISTITLSNRVFLDSPRLRRLRSVGAHGSASVRQEAELSKADWVTGCGRRVVLLVQSAWFMSHGKMASLFSRQGWKSDLRRITEHTSWPDLHICFPKHCKPKRFEQILLPLGSSNGDSVYSMQDAFPKLMINLIKLNSLQKRNHMYSHHNSGSVHVGN